MDLTGFDGRRRTISACRRRSRTTANRAGCSRARYRSAMNAIGAFGATGGLGQHVVARRAVPRTRSRSRLRGAGRSAGARVRLPVGPSLTGRGAAPNAEVPCSQNCGTATTVGEAAAVTDARERVSSTRPRASSGVLGPVLPDFLGICPGSPIREASASRFRTGSGLAARRSSG